MRACQTGQKQGSGKNEQVSGPSPYHPQTARGIAADGDEGEVAERVVASLFEEPIRKTAMIETESTMTCEGGNCGARSARLAPTRAAPWSCFGLAVMCRPYMASITRVYRPVIPTFPSTSHPGFLPLPPPPNFLLLPACLPVYDPLTALTHHALLDTLDDGTGAEKESVCARTGLAIEVELDTVDYGDLALPQHLLVNLDNRTSDPKERLQRLGTTVGPLPCYGFAPNSVKRVGRVVGSAYMQEYTILTALLPPDTTSRS